MLVPRQLKYAVCSETQVMLTQCIRSSGCLYGRQSDAEGSGGETSHYCTRSTAIDMHMIVTAVTQGGVRNYFRSQFIAHIPFNRTRMGATATTVGGGLVE
jgi:hypothetical protein